jgi:4-hydroxy-tetrahydrodipicolinate synthase
MPITQSLTGVAPIIPTPFRADEQIDFEALGRCVEFAAGRGLTAVCLPAYASEFYKLSEAERARCVETAIAAAAGRLAIIAQANHPSALLAAETARRYEALGASYISFALPRLFALPEADLLAYAKTICNAVKLPVLIQDFNPGGPTVGADFARRLADDCDNFRYLKLEESLMSGKIRSIIAATEGRIGVLEGWGGMYMLELMPAGICGLMPGLGVSDLLQRVWSLSRENRPAEALKLFQVVLPQVVFALQSSELFNWIEKRLLRARGVLTDENIHVRRSTWTPDEETLRYGDWLNEQIVGVARTPDMRAG